MIYIFYLVICISLSVVFSILTKKNNLEIEEMNEQIKLAEKMNKAVERWEKRKYRRRA